MYLGLYRDNVSTISDISRSFGVSRNHIIKVVHNLAAMGLVRTIRGRHGGMSLALDPEYINLAAVVQQTEPNFHLVECFSPNGNCCIEPACRLKLVLSEAFQSFFGTLGRYTLADLLKNKKDVISQLNAVEVPFRPKLH
jgi:Rrf2 family nitric oxide-sensitive transcriptional repressor